LFDLDDWVLLEFDSLADVEVAGLSFLEDSPPNMDLSLEKKLILKSIVSSTNVRAHIVWLGILFICKKYR
jgi:hypothetical protein